MTTNAKPLDAGFVALLACPACEDRPPLSLLPDNSGLTCAKCGRLYKIRDGFPDLIAEDAETPQSNLPRDAAKDENG